MRELAAVVVGGLVGTGLRLGLDELVPHRVDEFPVSTLVINLVGAFVLGFLVARIWPVAPTWMKSGLGAGLMGSFTTFSALALGVVSLSESGRLLTAVAYLVVTLVAGLAAAFFGITLGRSRTREVPEIDEVTE